MHLDCSPGHSCKRVNIHTYIHTYLHIYIHTYVHTYIRIQKCSHATTLGQVAHANLKEVLQLLVRSALLLQKAHTAVGTERHTVVQCLEVVNRTYGCLACNSRVACDAGLYARTNGLLHVRGVGYAAWQASNLLSAVCRCFCPISVDEVNVAGMQIPGLCLIRQLQSTLSLLGMAIEPAYAALSAE